MNNTEPKPDPHGGPVSPDPRIDNPIARGVVFLAATGLGAGYLPKAPGTFGTLVGVLLWWFMAPPLVSMSAYVVATLVFVLLAVLVSSAAEGIWRKKDDQRIVIDEVAGYLVTMFGAASVGDTVTGRFWLAASGFVLFRVFDIWKPWPARSLQNMPGGQGIVIDDVIAGIYGAIVLAIFGIFI